MSTIAAIARQVGVSPSAVSHMLNGREHMLGRDLQNRIRHAIQAHDYRSNALVRALKTGRTHTLGIVISTAQVSYFAEIANGVETAARSGGFQCFLCQSHSSAIANEREISTLREYRVDGLIVSPVHSFAQPDLYRQMLQRGVPLVLVDCEVEGVEAPYVGSDDLEIGRLGTRHLLELGHRRIACVAGDRRHMDALRRVEGYRQALGEAGISFDKHLVVGWHFSMEAGRDAVRALIERQVEFTAMVACTDMAAIGAMQELARHGLRVPQDVSVVGCADLEMASIVTPALTTLTQRPREIGRIAVRRLIEQMEGRTEIARRTLIPTALVVRDSTARMSGVKNSKIKSKIRGNLVADRAGKTACSV